MALSRALDVFWKDGFAATSLDDLSAATGMNRPSLYGAFGDKRELYKKTYESYRNRARARMGETFAADMPLRPNAASHLRIALDMYLSGEDGPRGCFTVMTATSEAVFDPDIRALVVSGLGEMDRFFCAAVQDRPGARRTARHSRSASAGKSRVGDHPHHRNPRPCPDPARGTGSARQRRG